MSKDEDENNSCCFNDNQRLFSSDKKVALNPYVKSSSGSSSRQNQNSQFEDNGTAKLLKVGKDLSEGNNRRINSP